MPAGFIERIMNECKYIHLAAAECSFEWMAQQIMLNKGFFIAKFTKQDSCCWCNVSAETYYSVMLCAHATCPSLIFMHSVHNECTKYRGLNRPFFSESGTKLLRCYKNVDVDHFEN